jgi:hypothetical protein
MPQLPVNSGGGTLPGCGRLVRWRRRWLHEQGLGQRNARRLGKMM